MTTSKKYDFRLVKKNDLWSAEITRRVSSEKTVVSKRQDGFATEAEAQEWGKGEVTAFIEKHRKKDKERSEQRKQAKMELALTEMSDEKPAPVKSKWDLIKRPAKES